MGLLFVTFSRGFADAGSPRTPRSSTWRPRCLFITGFAQLGFAASMIFSSALRGAGDTVTVMLINLACILGAAPHRRSAGRGVFSSWDCRRSGWCSPAELMIRGVAVFLRFLHGGWRHVKV